MSMKLMTALPHVTPYSTTTATFFCWFRSFDSSRLKKHDPFLQWLATSSSEVGAMAFYMTMVVFVLPLANFLEISCCQKTSAYTV